MSAAKQWQITREELSYDPAIDKLYNANKFAELNSQLKTVQDRFAGDENVKTFARIIAEEVTNIINKNSYLNSRNPWDNPLLVRTEFNKPQNEIGRLKVDLIYDGTEYWDPELKQTTTVVGSKGKFLNYNRSYEFDGNRTRIKINIEIASRK